MKLDEGYIYGETNANNLQRDFIHEMGGGIESPRSFAAQSFLFNTNQMYQMNNLNSMNYQNTAFLLPYPVPDHDLNAEHST